MPVFFATCAPGLESVLHQEVRALRVAKVEQQVGGVRFEGPWEIAWRANLWLRTAIRVLLRLSQFEARDADGLYDGVSAIDWQRFVPPDGSLLVDAQTKESTLDHSQFVAQRVKDAIVDQLRARFSIRPSVDKTDPDLRVHLHLWRDRATLSADTSGDSLHKRGWRRYQGRAPLAETSAAGLVQLAAWDRQAPLLDPFCGSGTILVEAALLAAGIAPGLFRSRFGFERWPKHDAAGFDAAKQQARQTVKRPKKLVLLGVDREPEHITGARANLAAAGVDDLVSVDTGDGLALRPRPGWNAWVVTNPPWGDRLGTAPAVIELYGRLGRWLRDCCQGYHAAVLCGDQRLAAALELAAARTLPLLTGGVAAEVVNVRLP